jgi:2-C-methyl-D-erythritol 4-phosphate cytidylyltransferase
MTSSAPQCWAVIPATGVGSRMGADRPKQYLPLGDKTVLEHTLDKLFSFHAIDGVMLILSESDDYWPLLNYHSDKPLLTCNGGVQRHHSVFNGLSALKSHLSTDSIVMIHDAVRPFVQHQDLERLLQVARECEDGALLATPLADTLKKARADLTVLNTPPRENLWRALTPQAFYLGKIYSALESVLTQNLMVTDDASAMELSGYHPRLVKGDGRNIKITHPEDLRLAELFLEQVRHQNWSI